MHSPYSKNPSWVKPSQLTSIKTATFTNRVHNDEYIFSLRSSKNMHTKNHNLEIHLKVKFD
ncbi:unnamed protein product [Chironomus riparius]|uniref:Uncharacterized protein n=1 Tax=Chironomus riparius TaxID=315576 RepID=A0A9N9RUB4_9DIPT|nr:unnamed protein product [Chironomus riparius]